MYVTIETEDGKLTWCIVPGYLWGTMDFLPLKLIVIVPHEVNFAGGSKLVCSQVCPSSCYQVCPLICHQMLLDIPLGVLEVRLFGMLAVKSTGKSMLVIKYKFKIFVLIKHFSNISVLNVLKEILQN